jgi:hypothetical protein
MIWLSLFIKGKLNEPYPYLKEKWVKIYPCEFISLRVPYSFGFGLKDCPVSSQELYQRLKQKGVLVVSGHYFFPGMEKRQLGPHATMHQGYLCTRRQSGRTGN